MGTDIQVTHGAGTVVDMRSHRTAGARPSSRSRRCGPSRSQYGLGESVVPIEELWADYKLTGDRNTRDQIIVHYWPLVKYVAGKVSTGLPSNVEQADLASYGMFGLIDAIDKFDISRDLKFETYAAVRIRGAIIDELRKVDWVPRSIRAKARWVDQARANLESRLGRTPTADEVAAELGLTEEEFRQISGRTDARGCISLDGDLSGVKRPVNESTKLADAIADAGPGPSTAFESAETRRIIAGSIGGLAERDRTVLTLYYYKGLTLAQIGKQLGLTESRVCQIHSKAIMQLRNRLSELQEAA